MCYLLVKPTGKAVKQEWLVNAYEAGNQDGFGLAYADKGKFVVFKTMEFSDLLSQVEKIPLGKNAIIHLRMASTGVVCEENCHPFFVGDMVGAHNGVIPGWGNADITDTEHFMAERVVSSHNLARSRLQLENEIGGGKMAFLLPNGQVEFLNRSRGIECKEGFWHSNTYYQPNRFNFGGWSYDGPEDGQHGDSLLDLIELMEQRQDCVPESLKTRFRRLISDMEAELYFYR